jgi:hypothetical protein
VSGAIVRELRESPQPVEEEPERAERNPGLMPQALRRAHRGRGAVGCSVAESRGRCHLQQFIQCRNCCW